MIEHSNILYIRDLSALGGVEQYEYEMATKYKDRDIALVYKTADQKQLSRIKDKCFCYKHTNEQIKCDVAVINYDVSIVDFINKEAKIYEVCHGDYHNEAYKWKMPTHPRIYKYIGITKKIEQNLIEDVGKDKVLQIYNPLTIPKENKPLILLSATRLSHIKGKDRMIKLAKELDNSGINYVWFIFTNDTNAINSPNVVYMNPTLNIDRWYDMADYLVQLSDTEACSYSINQMLYRNKPVIVTPLPYLEEIGVENNKNAYIMEFDCSNIKDIVNKITKVPKFEFKKLEDKYDEILTKEKSRYKEEEQMIELEVLITIPYSGFDNLKGIERANQDVKGIIFEGDKIIVDNQEIADYLCGNNSQHIIACRFLRYVVKEVETAVKEPKKVEKAVKNVRKKKVLQDK